MVDETTGHDAASSNAVPTGTPPVPPTGAPTGAPVSDSVKKQDQKMGQDINTILKDIKLPERRKAAVSGEKQAQKETKDIDALLSATPSEEAPTAGPAATPRTAPDVPPQRDIVQSLHTLKQDLQGVVRDQKISVVRAAALEQDKRDDSATVQAPPQRTNHVTNFVFSALLLLFLGGAALFGVYIVVQGQIAPLPEQKTDSLVFAERSVSLLIDGQSPAQLKGLIAQARNSSESSLGSIARIIPIKNVTTENGESTTLATLPEFFTAIGAHPPDDLVRALSQEFFFGLHTVDTNAPLLVVPVLSYDRAFQGMLAWEETLNADFAPIFTATSALTTGADGIPEKRIFSDIVMRNYDVRALKNNSGNIVLYYSFPTRDTLIIAESPYTFTELLSRLQAQRML